MDIYAARTSREIKQFVNTAYEDSNGNPIPINREDIVSIMYRDGQFILFYYK